MLKYMPIYGSILLTVIIVWIIVSTIIGNRRKIRQAVSGLYVRSTCCGATSTPFGWTADGWVLTCDECGAWQYLGDDHDNPPPGFNADGTPISRRLPAPRPSAASGPADEGQFVSRPTRFTGKMPALGAPYGAEVTSEITPYPHDCTCHPDDRPPICLRRHAASECVAAYRARYPEIANAWADVEPSMAERDAMFDQGEPLMLPPQPNIGGEGHPDYQGPHYNVEHDQFVPYDVLRDPLPGAAVHIVGNVACVGPIAVEPGDRGNATLDSSREDEDRV
jgi:hypothetical protein